MPSVTCDIRCFIIHYICITYILQFLQNGKYEHNISKKKEFLKLYCDQLIFFFKFSSTPLKRICPLDSKNTLVLVPAFFFFSNCCRFLPLIGDFLAIFEVGIEPSCNYACTSVPEVMCPSPWKLYIGDFPFFWFPSSSSRAPVRAVWSLGDNCHR